MAPRKEPVYSSTTEMVMVSNVSDNPCKTVPFKALLSPLPPRPLSIACPVDFCKVSQQPSRQQFEKLDQVLMKVFEKQFLLRKIAALLHQDKQLKALPTFSILMESLKNGDFSSRENAVAINSFKIEMVKILKEKAKTFEAQLARRFPQEAVDISVVLLIQIIEALNIQQDPCVCNMAASLNVLEFAIEKHYSSLPMQMFAENREKKYLGGPTKSYRKSVLSIIDAGWKKKQFSVNADLFTKKLDNLVLEVVESIDIWGTLDTLEIFNHFGGLMMVRNVFVQLEFGDSLPAYKKPVSAIALTVRANAKLGKPLTLEYLAETKIAADQAFKGKDFKVAIQLYSLISALAPTNSICFANTALARLQLAEKDPTQYSQSVADCTYALEFSPDYGKALYRRGVSLAKMKLWKKAIIDFERAIELDPRSPAVAELIIAKKNV